jgi:hypothetical protein
VPEPATKADYPETFRVLVLCSPRPGKRGDDHPHSRLAPDACDLAVEIAAMVIAVRQVLDYSTTGKAIIVVLIGFVINIIVTLVILAPSLGMRAMFS